MSISLANHLELGPNCPHDDQETCNDCPDLDTCPYGSNALQ